MLRLVGLGVVVSWLVGCSADTNLNQFWRNEGELAAPTILLEKADALYNAGDFTGALEAAKKAQDKDPDNPEIMIRIGYIHMALAGLEPIQLARKLIAVGSKTDSTTTGTGSSLQGSSGAGQLTSTLNKLGSFVNIGTSEFSNFGEKKTTSEILGGIEYISPNCADDARDKHTSLGHLRSALAAVCPIAGTVVNSEYNLHKCEAKDVSNPFPAKTNFLWAFSHLGEALAFNVIIAYTGATLTDKIDDFNEGTQTSVEKMSTSLQENTSGSTVQAVTNLVSGVKELTTVIGEIFPLSDTDDCNSANGKNPQLKAMLLDITATANAFAAMSGIPTDITSSITSALESFQNIGKDLEGTDQFTSQSQAFTATITDKLETLVTEKIDNLDLEAGDENLKALCDAQVQFGEEGDTVPEDCGGGTISIDDIKKKAEAAATDAAAQAENG